MNHATRQPTLFQPACPWQQLPQHVQQNALDVLTVFLLQTVGEQPTSQQQPTESQTHEHASDHSTPSSHS